MRPCLAALCLSAGLALIAPPALAANAPVTPLAPTVIDECGLGKDRVSIPDLPGVQYLVDIDGSALQLTPGAYAGVAFIPWDQVFDEDDDLPVLEDDGLSLPHAKATITVEALDGYVLADDATTSFDVNLSSAPCASTHPPLTVTTTCGSITFSNPAGNPDAFVMWGGWDDEAGHELIVPAGGQRSVDSAPGEILWFAQDDSVDDFGWTASPAQAAAPATTPDEVATDEDRRDLIDVAETLDLMMMSSMGDGIVDVAACVAPEDEESTPTHPSAPTTPGSSTPNTPTPSTPEVPAVVQTDGVITSRSPLVPLVPLALGGMAALASFLVLRPRRQD